MDVRYSDSGDMISLGENGLNIRANVSPKIGEDQVSIGVRLKLNIFKTDDVFCNKQHLCTKNPRVQNLAARHTMKQTLSNYK